MEAHTLGNAPAPPLRVLWRGSAAVASVVPSGGTLYGITTSGQLIAVTAETGATRWTNSASFVPARLRVDGATIYVLHTKDGLIAVEDKGNTYAERTIYDVGLIRETDTFSQPTVSGQLIHIVINDRLLALDPGGNGLRYDMTLPDPGPYSLESADGDLAAVSGAGRPLRIRAGESGYRTIWQAPAAPGTGVAERAVTVSDDLMVVGNREGVSAYHWGSGELQWTNPQVGNMAIVISGANVFCAGNQAALWALRTSDGTVQWDRKYLTFVSQTPRVALAVGEDHLWVGALLADGAEPAALWAVNKTDGSFAWQATGVTLQYGTGLPLVSNGRLITYGSSDALTTMAELGVSPGVTLENIKQTPNPLRGPMSGFNPVTVEIRLLVPASVSFIAWHERDERSNSIGPIAYLPGRHNIHYDARWPRGWTDTNQFGRLTFDIEEQGSSLKYSQVLLVPVNTLPDVHHHWAKSSIETMIYHKFIGGYPDLTFRPNNLVTRAESSTIIANTLGLEKPSSSFKTKLTDIATHWAKNQIMALEEKGIVGGFLEADGTYTFRPNLMMTRAQEARILVKAYEIPAAPAGFQSRFVDVSGHWAETDIKALEAAGYVTGFREDDGTYTYRPEQNLTRAELSTVVVRIRKLTRG